MLRRCSEESSADSKGYLARQPEIATARADRKRVRSRGTHPRLADDVPDRQVVSRERDTDHLRLARLQIHVGEPAQDGRRLYRPRGEMQVQLGYLFLGFSPRIRDARQNDENLIYAPPFPQHFQCSAP